jgi:hypothetical protein
MAGLMWSWPPHGPSDSTFTDAPVNWMSCLPRASGDALATAIPGFRLVLYPNTGHLVLWEQPARIAWDLTTFLTTALSRRHPDRAGPTPRPRLNRSGCISPGVHERDGYEANRRMRTTHTHPISLFPETVI